MLFVSHAVYAAFDRRYVNSRYPSVSAVFADLEDRFEGDIEFSKFFQNEKVVKRLSRKNNNRVVFHWCPPASPALIDYMLQWALDRMITPAAYECVE
jgi:hypothetical protein